MEKLSFHYSLQNIPPPEKRSYQLKLIEKIESAFKKIDGKRISFCQKRINNQKP